MTLDDERRRMLRERLLREHRSQAEMARFLGVSAKHLNRVLNGRANFSEELWLRAAQALGCRWEIRLVATTRLPVGRRMPPQEGVDKPGFTE